MIGPCLAAIWLLAGALVAVLWGFHRQAEHVAQLEERLYLAGLVNDTLVEDLRISWGEPADDDIDQAVQLANSPRYEAIVALIAANEAARFDADGVDWGQP